MGKQILDLEKYKAIARRTAADGCVLLENENQALPLKNGRPVALFGRIAFHYYKSGSGSGGLVNTAYVTGILDALKEEKDIPLDEELMHVYEEWIRENPFDQGKGWGLEPWSQKEMPLDEELVKQVADRCETAVLVIGRTAGEDRDSSGKKGSYLLSDGEEAMLEITRRYFKKTVVLLNVGSLPDLSWIRVYRPDAVLVCWQGGQEGGNGVVDVLTGRVTPSGKLPDTAVMTLDDYPSSKNFGDPERNIYEEDIFVGYRYFETFAKERVLYPFGFGRSYTDFSLEVKEMKREDGEIRITAEVTNTGAVSGREVLQLYFEGPKTVLGRPARELAAFEKTEELMPGETQTVSFTLKEENLASFDDSGVTGNKDCWVLEEGIFTFHVGNSVRNTIVAGTFEQKQTVVTERCREALAPVLPFERLKADENGKPVKENAPLRTVDLQKRIREELPEALPYTGDLGYKLLDVREGRVSLDTFLAQLSDYDLACMVRGEGMCSPKATPGTAGAFGGVTEELKRFGIPIACCADGPSGIRMDCGTIAFSLPNGCCIGSTFDLKLIEELFTFTGLELKKNRVDTLLGPGINIHRNPLNGRNFEYFSEDPLLTGKMAAAELNGMHRVKVTGTMKHYACNNQEWKRSRIDAVVSARALREIYLKGYRIAVEEGKARSIMTTYGGLNGIWTAGNYDLCTTVLRNEWDFDGIAMTDWWARMNEEGEEPSTKNTGLMVRAQNDLFMVVDNSATNSLDDNSMESLENGIATRAQFVRSAKNICSFLLRSNCMDVLAGEDCDVDILGMDPEDAKPPVIDGYYDGASGAEILPEAFVRTDGGTTVIGVKFLEPAYFDLELALRMEASDLAQLTYSVFVDEKFKGSIALNGKANRETETFRIDLGIQFGLHFLKLVTTAPGLVCEKAKVIKTAELDRLPF